MIPFYSRNQQLFLELAAVLHFHLHHKDLCESDVSALIITASFF